MRFGDLSCFVHIPVSKTGLWHGMWVLSKYLPRDWRVFIVGLLLTAENLGHYIRSTSLMVKLQDNPHEAFVKKYICVQIREIYLSNSKWNKYNAKHYIEYIPAVVKCSSVLISLCISLSFCVSFQDFYWDFFQGMAICSEKHFSYFISF